MKTCQLANFTQITDYCCRSNIDICRRTETVPKKATATAESSTN